MNIFIATGGTGGHIIPAICLAKFLKKESHKITILGDKKCLQYLKEEPIEFRLIYSAKNEKNNFAKLFGLIKISIGVLQSLFLILVKKPKYIICFGGYATFPTCIAATLARKRLILHEQNAHIGKVNKLFAKYANKIALTFKDTEGLEGVNDKDKIHYTGIPLKKDITKLNKEKYFIPSFEPQKFDMQSRMGYDVLLKSDFNRSIKKRDFFTITVIGGSGGAKIFSDILPRAIFNIKNELKPKILIFQQCRRNLLKNTFEKYKSYGINVIADEFFSDMPTLLSNSQLIIARCGASSLFEISASKKPAIIVPFAESSDDHQLKNAQYFANNNAAILIKEKDFTINNVTKILNNIILNQSELEKLSLNISKLAQLSAEKEILKLIK